MLSSTPSDNGPHAQLGELRIFRKLCNWGYGTTTYECVAFAAVAQRTPLTFEQCPQNTPKHRRRPAKAP